MLSIYSEAVFFNRMPITSEYQPDLRPPKRLHSTSVRLGMKVEDYVSITDNVGILLIHLSEAVKGINTAYDRKKSIEHIACVLRISIKYGRDIAILHQKLPMVMPELQPCIKNYEKITAIYQPTSHMGGNDVAYQKFARSHRSVVVMGFDANICVFANIFGCPETSPTGQSWTAPLLSMSSVVTSRAVLIYDSPLYPVNYNGEYGILAGL